VDNILLEGKGGVGDILAGGEGGFLTGVFGAFILRGVGDLGGLPGCLGGDAIGSVLSLCTFGGVCGLGML